MTTPATPSAPKPAGDDRKLVSVDETYIAPSFEDSLNLFWKKNGTAVLVLCGVVLVGICAKGGWDYLQGQKELEVEQAYAAATTSDQLKSFAAAHADHSLAGIAQLRLADEAYAAGKSAEAVAAYDKAVTALKTGPLAARAQLGRALSKAQAGKSAEATTELKQLASDAGQLKGVRAEAAYQLASLAAEALNAADVQKYSDQLMQLDPSGPWAQRAMMLRASLPPAPAAPAPAKTRSGRDPGEGAGQVIASRTRGTGIFRGVCSENGLVVGGAWAYGFGGPDRCPCHPVNVRPHPLLLPCAPLASLL